MMTSEVMLKVGTKLNMLLGPCRNIKNECDIPVNSISHYITVKGFLQPQDTQFLVKNPQISHPSWD